MLEKYLNIQQKYTKLQKQSYGKSNLRKELNLHVTVVMLINYKWQHIQPFISSSFSEWVNLNLVVPVLAHMLPTISP
jgi:hypothetical protein